MNLCTWTLKKGKNKGKLCNLPTKKDNRCFFHLYTLNKKNEHGIIKSKIRKIYNRKCIHNKFKQNCVICFRCKHNRNKYKCRICSNNIKNEINKNNCLEYNYTNNKNYIRRKKCAHDTYEKICRICNDCGHGKLKRFCNICNDCGHGNVKRFCKICKNEIECIENIVNKNSLENTNDIEVEIDLNIPLFYNEPVIVKKEKI